jgi:hypothetical protein
MDTILKKIIDFAEEYDFDRSNIEGLFLNDFLNDDEIKVLHSEGLCKEIEGDLSHCGDFLTERGYEIVSKLLPEEVEWDNTTFNDVPFKESYGFENRKVRTHTVPVYKNDAKIKDGDLCVVSLYTTQRHYGGAEEGGWWYNWNTHEFSIPTLYSKENVENMIELYKDKIREYIHGDIYSVRGGVSGFIQIEKEAGSQASTEVPRYE